MVENTIEYLKIILFTTIAYYLSFKVSYYFLPISFALVFNAMMRIFSLSHDCIHGSFSSSKVFNRICGSFLGYFLLGISFQKYKTYHLLHHKYLNTKLDPDKPIETINPTFFKSYISTTVKRILTFELVSNHILYYTDLFNWNKKTVDYKKDHYIMLLYWSILIIGFAWSGYLVEFVVIWVLPMSLFTLVIELLGLIQHRSLVPVSQDFARNIYGGKLALEVFMPTGINLHRSHHELPQVTWYQLSRYNKKSSNDIVIKDSLINIFDFN
tara:strand:+ start:137 stop:943 length:807 start_codon:yes stop_codon:yes gene_type:complete